MIFFMIFVKEYWQICKEAYGILRDTINLFKKKEDSVSEVEVLP